MSEITRRPPWLSGAVGGVAITIVVTLTAFADPLAAMLAVTGLAGYAVGWLSIRPRLIDLGALALALAVLAGAVTGWGPVETGVATVAAVVAWHLGTASIALGDQLGRRARTVRLELLHLAIAIAVGAPVGVLVYGTQRSVAGGQPVAAVALLLLGAAAVVLALGESWRSRRVRIQGR